MSPEMTENGYPYSAGYANFDSPVILPVQFYELVGRRHVLEGEYKLMFAVLEDAIHTCFKNLNARTPEESQESLRFRTGLMPAAQAAVMDCSRSRICARRWGSSRTACASGCCPSATLPGI